MTGKIETIGVIGAGQMGSGIAHVSALAGYNVLLFDVAPERIEKGIATVSGNMARQVSSGKLDEAVRQGALSRIAAAPTMQGLAGADLVIEAATEDESGQAQDLRAALPGAQSRKRSWRPTPRRSRSPGSPRRPTGRSASSAFTS